MSIHVLGAGAFGTALAIALSARGPVTLWARDVSALQSTGESPRLPGVPLPENVTVSAEICQMGPDDIALLAVPLQQLSGFLRTHATALGAASLLACAKGVEVETGRGPAAIIADQCPDATAAVLTGPSFAADIARGLPTALTLACADESRGEVLQHALSTPALRLYRSSDVTGAELGGALKNVVAIATGIVIGAQLGDSARAALLTRGFAEMQRLALALGAQPDTLSGLSGLGDLVLTCTSTQSRNFRYGLALGQGRRFDPDVTVEGVATARAVARLAVARDIDMPLCTMIAAVIEGAMSVDDATRALMARPLKEE